MRIIKHGSCDLYAFCPNTVDINDVVSIKKLEVYINIRSLERNVRVDVSEIKNGSFTLTSNNDCNVSWILVESNELDMLSYMKFYPIF
jgi:hypothetical protein